MLTTPVSLLVRLRQPNNHEAWNRFVSLYTRFLVYLLGNRLGVREQDVPDLVQEIFLTLLRSLATFEYDPKKGKFRGYLFQICCSRLTDWKRKGQPPAANDAALSELEDAKAKAELERVWQHDHNEFLVRQAMKIMQAEFQPTTWKACWETVVNGRPAAEVALEAGISENAVFIAKCRVIRRLKEELEGMLDV